MNAGELIVTHKKEIGDTKFYTLTKYCRDVYERTVVYDGDTIQCSCRFFDSRGLPCSHIFHVMKEEHVDHIPSTLVLSQWTKDAKIDYLNMVDVNDPVDSDVIELARFGAYCSVLTTFCKEASKKNGVVEDPIGTQKLVVGDPIPVQSKGAPKKKKNDTKALRHCTHCKTTTHNAKTCSIHVPSVQHVPPVQHVTSVPHVPPVYQVYGMNVGANSTSCYGLLQQVMKSADQQ
ncbi:protein FAR1-RELATED SEQUENCE 2-like [Trifolium pratense]|uniref:protein FAR1-RELATED SEQUENCE 2-like n=1 Tax=Trifolium pratense TaxID=57577 RepID=UPI001E69350D|nr:protein FAR1-RELATED SEQUENCE 2-like [Trifolium pratense]